MEYQKVELLNPTKRSRRTKNIHLDDYGKHIFLDIESSPNGADDNYLAILVGYGASCEIAFGGAKYESDPTNDPLPSNEDFYMIGSNGHYEVDGRMFNRDLRVWIRGTGNITIVY